MKILILQNLIGLITLTILGISMLNVKEDFVKAESSTSSESSASSKSSKSSASSKSSESSKSSASSKSSESSKSSKSSESSKSSNSAKDALQPNFSHLDLRVGMLDNVDAHPRAKKLDIMEIDVGEKKFVQMVTSIFSYNVTLFDMAKPNQFLIFLLNAKPIKLQGEWSYGMIMCAEENGIALLRAPLGSKVGDNVTVEGYERNPLPTIAVNGDFYRNISKDFWVDSSGIATYKGKPWIVKRKDKIIGKVTAENVTNVPIF